MEDRGRRLFDSFLFYAIVLMMVTLLAALFLPAASVLREVGNERGQGPWILLPLSFLILSFLYGFIRARGYLHRPKQEIVTDRWVLKQGRRLLAENAYGEYEDGRYLLYTDRDDSITIRRIQLPEKDRSSGIFGGEIRKKDGILLEVQNRSKEKKSLKIVERIPYSSTDKIEVKLLKVEGAKRESRGIWKAGVTCRSGSRRGEEGQNPL